MASGAPLSSTRSALSGAFPTERRERRRLGGARDVQTPRGQRPGFPRGLGPWAPAAGGLLGQAAARLGGTCSGRGGNASFQRRRVLCPLSLSRGVESQARPCRCFRSLFCRRGNASRKLSFRLPRGEALPLDRRFRVAPTGSQHFSRAASLRLPSSPAGRPRYCGSARRPTSARPACHGACHRGRGRLLRPRQRRLQGRQ